MSGLDRIISNSIFSVNFLILTAFEELLWIDLYDIMYFLVASLRNEMQILFNVTYTKILQKADDVHITMKRSKY